MSYSGKKLPAITFSKSTPWTIVPHKNVSSTAKATPKSQPLPQYEQMRRALESNSQKGNTSNGKGVGY